MSKKLKATGIIGKLSSHFDPTYDLKKADIGIMPGGGDWYPKLYADSINIKSHYTISTDIAELVRMKCYLENGLTILGICRGAQGLCIISGGALFQDVNNHHGVHKVFVKKGKNTLTMTTNSCHHQMLDLNNLIEQYEYNLIAWSDVSNHITGLSSSEIYDFREPEMVSFPLIKGLGVQGHPEWADMPSPYFNIMMEKLEELHDTPSDASIINEVIIKIDEKLELLEEVNRNVKHYLPSGGSRNYNYDDYEDYTIPAVKPKKKDDSYSFDIFK